MLEKQINDLLVGYLIHQIDRAEFAQAFAGLYFQVRNDRNVSREIRQMCDSLVLPFAELSRGHRSESSFREVLARIARPFFEFQPKPFMVSESEEIELDFGITRKPPMAAVRPIGVLEERLVSVG